MKIAANIIDGTATLNQFKAWAFSIEWAALEDDRIQTDEPCAHLISHIREQSIADYVQADDSVDYKISYHILNTVKHLPSGKINTVSIATVFEYPSFTRVTITPHVV